MEVLGERGVTAFELAEYLLMDGADPLRPSVPWVRFACNLVGWVGLQLLEPTTADDTLLQPAQTKWERQQHVVRIQRLRRVDFLLLPLRADARAVRQ
eukprot:7014556-Prymnesium_polylepis.1